tara:strand:+ start:10 stop:1245 length:1236 start_codon:yes stop_codon:yes gene_type:complete
MRYAIGKVSGVFIGPEKAIKFFGLRKKAVKPTRGTLRECYEREVECLRRLQGLPGFPILHAARDKEMIVEMENCGEHLFSTWHEHNLILYLDQANRICDGLEKANIQYFFAGLNKEPLKPPIAYNPRSDVPLSNLCIKDGELHLIDFEMANPKGFLEDTMHPKVKELFSRYDPDKFRKFLLTGLKYPKESFEKEMWRKIPPSDHKEKIWKRMKEMNPREAFKSMTTYNIPNPKYVDAWKKYQKRFGIDDAINRVKNMKLDQICKDNHKLVDIGCNDGYITELVAPMVASATGVEPHVELPNTNTVKWIKKTFNEFVQNNTKQYDILLSLAVSIQLRDFGGLTEDQIVDYYYDIVAPNGIVVHETQKLENRPNNIDHTNKMITAFKEKFKQIDHGPARAGGKREYYHFLKVA